MDVPSELTQHEELSQSDPTHSISPADGTDPDTNILCYFYRAFPSISYFSVSQTFFNWGPLLLVRMFYGHPTLVPLESKLFEILNYSVWYAIHVNFIFSAFFGLMFNLRGPQGQNPRTTCGPRTTV
jgi:hypothetical protein